MLRAQPCPPAMAQSTARSGLHGIFHPLEYVPCSCVQETSTTDQTHPTPNHHHPARNQSETLRSSPSCRIKLKEPT